MPMKFRCTACTARLHVPKRWAGATIECPKCATRVVVPREPPEPEQVRFEDRSLEKRIAAFEADTLAAMTAAAAVGSSPGIASGNGSLAGGSAGEVTEGVGGAMIAVPSRWVWMLSIAVVLAMAASAAGGFWAGWLASQSMAK